MLGTLFNIGDTISFSVYPAVILGNNFKNLKVEGVVPARLAVASGFDVYGMHANVYPTLPTNSPNSADKYNYVLLRNVNDELICVGEVWINQSTIVRTTTTNLEVTILGAGAAHIALVREALQAQGLDVGTIEVKAP